MRTQGRRPSAFRRALLSVFDQTWRPIQIIVVVDGDPADIVLPAHVPEGISIETQAVFPPQGRCVAGNVGLEIASGDFMCFLDDDDVIFPEHLSTLIEALSKAPEAQAAFGLSREVGRRVRTVGNARFSRAALWVSNCFPIQAVLFRREAYEILGGFDPEFDALEDWDLWIRYSALGDFVGVDAVTSSYEIPKTKAALLERAANHEIYKNKILLKHAHTVASFSFNQLNELRNIWLERLDDEVGVRWCLGRVLRRIQGS